MLAEAQKKKYKIRSIIAAEKGKRLIACDLSQAETWIVAYLANDMKMKYALHNSDIHTETAMFVFEKSFPHVTPDERYLGKRLNHANNYGMSYILFAHLINAKADEEPFLSISLAEAKRYMEGWHRLYTSVRPWWKSLEEELKRNNKTVSNLYGRARTFFGPLNSTTYRELYAFKPQSTVADHFNGQVQRENPVPGGLLKVWQVICKSGKSPDIKLRNQSHDSCILSVPAESAEDILIEVMSYIRRPIIINEESCTIPVDGEIGERWGEMEKFKPKVT